MACLNNDGSPSVADTFRRLAEEFSKKDSPQEAFNYYIISLNLNPALKDELKASFASTLCDLGKILEHEKNYDDLFSSYEVALKIFPQNEIILNNLGAHLCRLQEPKAGLHYFQKALELNSDYLPAYRNIQIAKSLLVERWHFRMLNDSIRNESYRRAICRKISEGHETVLDIGTGSGILSIYAKEGGAKKIYACDYSQTMISITNQVIRANSMTDSITAINKLSNNLSIPQDIPQRLSLGVTETFDGGLLGENILETLIHALENLLLPVIDENGKFVDRVVPKGAVLYAMPVECLQIARKNYIIKSDRIQRQSFRLGIDLSEANFYYVSDEPYDTENLKGMSYSSLAPPLRLFEFNFNDLSELKKYYSGEISQSFQMTISKKGFIDCFAVWFEVFLDDETTITSSPFQEDRSCWEQAIFPQSQQWAVEEGVAISLFSTCKSGILSLNSQKDLCANNEERNISIPQSIISFLNCESFLLSYIKLMDILKGDFNGKTSLLEISYFPYSSILLAQRESCEAFFSNPNSEIISGSEEILNSLEMIKYVRCTPWADVVTWTENKKKQFDIICIDILDTTGQINEEVIVLLPALRNLLSPGGYILPSKLNVWCKLAFSHQLLISSQVNESNDKLKIAEFVNEYKVSHMIDINIHEMKYEEITESFLLGTLDLRKLNNDRFRLVKEEYPSRSGYVNSILYWFSYQFNDDFQHSTLSQDSHVNHCAVILDSPLQVSATSKINILLEHLSGVIRFQLSAH